MKDKIEIGAAPPLESCAQVGCENYASQARKECAAYIRQIKRELGDPPAGARLCIGSNYHDFGTYYEVAVVFDADIEDAVKYAYDCEGKGPGNWDIAAKVELGLLPADTAIPPMTIGAVLCSKKPSVLAEYMD